VANERKTTPGVGRVGPDPPSLQARVDWVADPPPAYVALRRAELVHDRRVAWAKVAAGGTGLSCAVALIVVGFVLGGFHPGLGVFAVFAGWSGRWLFQQATVLRHNTLLLESLDRRPALPAARVVVREH
jgi:hypothetical protein